jgi:transglutaminase-like putative cysteine protease
MAPEARSQAAAAVVFLGAIVLVAAYAPPWTIAIAAACAIWRLGVASGRLPAPRLRKGMRFVFGAATALLVGAVLMSFHTLNGLAAGTALLVLMGALKVLESRSRRDDGIVIGVALFLLLAAALAGQSLARLPFYLLEIWGACAAMMLVAHPASGLPLRAALRLSTRTLAMAVPLAAACFLFFPRWGGQFWAMPGGGGAATGLSDEMAPGAIDRLVADYEPAFRVRFEGAPPPPEERYWRGPVLNSFDGFTWRREPRNFLYPATPITPLGPAVRYRITLEPTNRPWLVALDMVDDSPRRGVYLAHDRLLWRSEPITDTLVYDASSHLRTVTIGPLSSTGRRQETRLPDGPNPRAVALARELRATAADDADFSRKVLDWFVANGLEYTLEPEPTSIDSVDSVLFDTRRGFCGHFASAYATLMRAAGVPARVVTGYLGGEWNPIGEYLIVRQSEAHAWTEIWLEGRGWTRVDPTAVVEPGRLRSGVYDLLADASTPVGVAIWRSRWVAALGRYWDGANHWWRERVLQFNLRAQLGFLRDLGIESPDWRTLGWIFAGALLLWLVWVSVTFRRSVPRVKPDRIARAWLRATRRLARIAAPRAPSEGAIAYAQRIAAIHPHLAAPLTSIALRYTRLRFGRDAPHEEIVALEREVRRLAA